MAARQRKAQAFLAVLDDSGLLHRYPRQVQCEIVSQARATRLLSRLAVRAARSGELTRLPEPVRAWFEWANRDWEQSTRRSDWELTVVDDALRDLDVPVVLLKGAAYRALGCTCSVGRTANDLDIMVGRGDIPAVESRLLGRGWYCKELTESQEAFYRRSMHELPTFAHGLHGIELDVHHNIVPTITRFRVDARKLLGSAVSVDGGDMRVLGPEDRLIHCAVHLFVRGEFRNGLRDLRDFHEMLCEAPEGRPFWDAFLGRCLDFGVDGPVYLAERYARRFWGRVMPDYTRDALARRGRRWLGLWMDAIYVPALLPPAAAGYDHARARRHACLRHSPPCLWRKTLYPKLRRITVFSYEGRF